MPTATILGTEYPTVVMPDGKEWMAANLAYVSGGVGLWFGGAGSDTGSGAYYPTTQIDDLKAVLTEGWRVATIAGDVVELIEALTANGYDATYLVTSDFAWVPSGYRFPTGTWSASNADAGILADSGDTENVLSMFGYATGLTTVVTASYAAGVLPPGGISVFACNLRLVRDRYACPPPQVSATFRGMAPVETVTFASGRSRRVSRGTQAFYLDATFQWTFTYEEYEAFIAWWDNALAYGTLPTTVLAPWGDTEQEHSFVFRGKYSVTRDDFSMKVSAPVRITDFHTTIYTSFGNLYQTAPIEYPTELPVPQMDVREKIAQLRTDIQGNAGGASSPLTYRGFILDLSWSLSGLELDQFVVWFANCLRCGQRKFKAAIGPLAEMVYTVLGEPTVSISGVDRRVSMTVQAVLPVTLPSSVIPLYVDTVNAALDLYTDTVNNALDQYVDTVGA